MSGIQAENNPQIETSLTFLVKNLFETTTEHDIIFISNEKQEIKAHKLILSLFSKFFKELFSDCINPFVPQVIVLPNYSTNVINAFIQFFYTGEVLIHERLLPDFVSICREFKCDEIPSLSEILNPKIDHQAKVETNQPSITQFLDITEECNVVQEDSEAHVESIFFKVVENEVSNDELNSTSNVKEEYLNEEYIEENPQYEFMEVLEKRINDEDQFSIEQSQSESQVGWTNDNQQSVEEFRKPKEKKLRDSKIIKKDKKASISFPVNLINIKQLREEQEKFKKRLQEAVNSVRDNINSVKKAAKLFDVPTSAIERNLKTYKSQ